MATISAISWSPSLSSRVATTQASLTYFAGTFVSVNGAVTRSPLLHFSFIPSSSLSSSCSFSGSSLGLDLSSNVGLGRKRSSGLVVRAGKAALCLTKRSRSRKSLARTHGFRRRMRTTSGRAMLKRRRAKGRKVLCTKSLRPIPTAENVPDCVFRVQV